MVNNQPELMNKELLEFKHRMQLVVENGGSHFEQFEDHPSSDDDDHHNEDDDVYPDAN